MHGVVSSCRLHWLQVAPLGTSGCARFSTQLSHSTPCSVTAAFGIRFPHAGQDVLQTARWIKSITATPSPTASGNEIKTPVKMISLSMVSEAVLIFARQSSLTTPPLQATIPVQAL